MPNSPCGKKSDEERQDDMANNSKVEEDRMEAGASAAAAVPPGGSTSRPTERDALEDQEDREDQARASSSYKGGAVAVGDTASGNELGNIADSEGPAEEQDRGGGLLTTLSGYVVQPQHRRAPLTVSQLLANAPLVDGVAIPELEEQEEGNFFWRHRKAISISAILVAIGGGVAGAVSVIHRDLAKRNGADQVQPTVQGCGPFPRPAEEQSLNELFCTALPSSCALLSNMSSPQCVALRWLALDPALSSYSDGQKKERYALATLYKSTSGLEDDERWTDYRWRECIWPGVTCTSEGLNVLNFGRTKENVTTGELDFIGGESLLFGGTLPKELSLLASVEHIYMSGCELNSTIPSEVCKMSSLKNLWINMNSISGSLPSCIGNLTRLATLNLGDYNELTGKVPSSVGGLKELTYLNLGGNWLTGSVPSNVGGLKELQYLDLGGNELTGSVPSNVGGLKGLKFIHLSSNSLHGSIPSSMGQLMSLQYLDLSWNDLTGSISSNMGELRGLEVLYLEENALTGTIPSEMSQLSGLEVLYLSSNALTGTVPTEMVQLSNLWNLELHNNALTGTVPEALCALADNAELNTSIWADCLGDTPEVVCTCCEVCCNKTMCCWDDGYCYSI